MKTKCFLMYVFREKMYVKCWCDKRMLFAISAINTARDHRSLPQQGRHKIIFYFEYRYQLCRTTKPKQV